MSSDDQFGIAYDSQDEGGFDFDEYDEFGGYDSDGFDENDYNDEDYEYDAIGLESSFGIQRQMSYSSLKDDQLEKHHKKILKEIVSILALPSRSFAMILLNDYEWNQERLIAAYFDNEKKVLRNAGIKSLKIEKRPSSRSKIYECLICFDEVPGSETYALGCGHRYCKECWAGLLSVKLGEGFACVKALCPNPKCSNVIHDRAWKKLVPKITYQKYQSILLKSIILDNPHLKYCPAPDCGFVMQCDRRNRREPVICDCGFSYCFICSDFKIGNHAPATCEQVEMWNRKAADESENVAWIIANCKKCPNAKCGRPIEKNGGCMHMTCRTNAGGCGHEFCWLCRGDWKDHGSHTGGYYSCNKYDESDAKTQDTSNETLRNELEKYMFYYHRYESHYNAMKIADEQRKKTVQKSVNLVARFEVRSQDTQFLLEATEVLIRSRQCLAYSYIVGWSNINEKSVETNLFQYLQEDLEKHTNHLSEIYERDLESIIDYPDFIKWKEDVTNYTRVTASFLDKFNEGVIGGLM